MGANKNSNRQKCGNILININTIKNKNKIFTFHCAFCSTDCDQLKKFSKHLEEHLHHFEDAEHTEDDHVKCPNLVFEPKEIKVEETLDMEVIDEGYKRIVNSCTSSEVYGDPLDTMKAEKNVLTNMCSIEDFVITDLNVLKDEQEEILKDDAKSCDITSYNMTDDNSRNSIPKTDSDIEDTTKNINQPYPFKSKDFSSDEFSDDSNDPDFDVEIVEKPKKETKTKKSKYSEEKKKSAKETSDVDEVEKESNTVKKHKRCKKRWKNIDVSKLPILIEMYKKHEVLWQVNDIAFGILAKRNETFGKMIEELKSDHDFDKNLDELQDYIDYINFIFCQDREQELKCELDKTEFTPSSEFYEKLSFLGDSQGPFKCPTCNEIIAKYDRYHIHVAQHNGTIPFQCRLCEMGFPKFDNYLRHVARHLGINTYHCNVCGKGYPFKSELDWHLTSHTGVKPYLCPICGAGFRARHGYDNHVRRHEQRFRYECHICKHGFNHLCKLNTHIKSHLNIRDVICNVCGKGFTAAKYLHRHKLIHEEEKRYKCKVCGKAFAQDSGLRAHRKQHQPYATIAENKNLLNVFQ